MITKRTSRDYAEALVLTSIAAVAVLVGVNGLCAGRSARAVSSRTP